MANEEFKRVLKGVRGDNPEHKRREAAEAKRKKLVAKGERDAKRARDKRAGGHRGGDDVIDTGMFGS